MKALTTLAVLACSTTAFAQTFTINDVSFEMVKVEGGSFYMGGQRDDATLPNYDAEISQYVNTAYPVHNVELSTFHIGKYEVTQELWKAALGEELLKVDNGIGAGDNYPVYYISYNNCLELVYTLNNKLKDVLNGAYFTIPSEAQWEYAARGGVYMTETFYAGSNTSDVVAWTRENSKGVVSEVGKLSPNELGIYDMTGNVQEWCADYYFNSYDNYPDTKDPIVTSYNSYNIIRGGHFMSPSLQTKIYNRDYQSPTQSNTYSGFRLALIGYVENSTAITPSTQIAESSNTDVYSLSGVLIKRNATPTEIKTLPKGVYIINNKLIAK